MTTIILPARLYDARRAVVRTVYRLYVNGSLYATYRTRADAAHAANHVI